MVNFFNDEKEFVTAVNYTAARFEFSDALIEKDFLCSMILRQ